MKTENIGLWWQEDEILNVVLPFLNEARRCGEHEQIKRCENLIKALDKMWTCYFQHRQRIGQLNEIEREARSDSQAIKELMLRGLGENNAKTFCASGSVRCLAELKPHVLNHDKLVSEGYNPRNIPDALKKIASEAHRKLENAFRLYDENPNEPDRAETVLKKVADLLYIVRSNIAHSEKTPKGPDLKKGQRDHQVSETAANVVEELFDIIFQRPSRRLAVYGSLRPGEANNSQLKNLVGSWDDGSVAGKLSDPDGFQSFRWQDGDGEIPVKVLSAAEALPFGGLDKFEGLRYQRILVPVKARDLLSVCNIYEGRDKAER